MSEVQVIEVRCDENPHRMFVKLLVTDRPVIVAGNLLEFACRDCAKDRHAARVLHRFNVVGELVETEIVYDSQEVDTHGK